MSDLERNLTGKQVEDVVGFKATKRNEETAAGRLPAVKLGRLTLYPESGVRAYLASLPKATFGSRKGQQRRMKTAPAHKVNSDDKEVK